MVGLNISPSNLFFMQPLSCAGHMTDRISAFAVRSLHVFNTLIARRWMIDKTPGASGGLGVLQKGGRGTWVDSKEIHKPPCGSHFFLTSVAINLSQCLATDGPPRRDHLSLGGEVKKDAWRGRAAAGLHAFEATRGGPSSYCTSVFVVCCMCVCVCPCASCDCVWQGGGRMQLMSLKPPWPVTVCPEGLMLQWALPSGRAIWDEQTGWLAADTRVLLCLSVLFIYCSGPQDNGFITAGRSLVLRANM